MRPGWGVGWLLGLAFLSSTGTSQGEIVSALERGELRHAETLLVSWLTEEPAARATRLQTLWEPVLEAGGAESLLGALRSVGDDDAVIVFHRGVLARDLKLIREARDAFSDLERRLPGEGSVAAEAARLDLAEFRWDAVASRAQALGPDWRPFLERFAEWARARESVQRRQWFTLAGFLSVLSGAAGWLARRRRG